MPFRACARDRRRVSFGVKGRPLGGDPRRGADKSRDGLGQMSSSEHNPADRPRSVPKTGTTRATGAAHIVDVPPDDVRVLERWARSPTAPYRLVLRARIVLLAHRGLTIHETAATLGTTPRTVRLWRERYARRGCTGLERDAAGRGRKPELSVQTIEAIVAAGRLGTRPDGRPWSIRSLAAAYGASPSAVYRICRAHGVRPGLVSESEVLGTQSARGADAGDVT